MKPEITKSNATCRFGLSNLICMMNGNMINTTGVNIKSVAQDRHCHGATFEMPTRETRSRFAGIQEVCQCVPFHVTLFATRSELPQCKIGWIMFFDVDGNACSGLLCIQVQPGKISVGWEFGCIKINTVVNFISET